MYIPNLKSKNILCTPRCKWTAITKRTWTRKQKHRSPRISMAASSPSNKPRLNCAYVGPMMQFQQHMDTKNDWPLNCAQAYLDQGIDIWQTIRISQVPRYLQGYIDISRYLQDISRYSGKLLNADPPILRLAILVFFLGGKCVHLFRCEVLVFKESIYFVYISRSISFISIRGFCVSCC